MEWISVKDRLPDKNTICLVFAENNVSINNVSILQYSGVLNVWCYSGIPYSAFIEPTHWMPLPGPPKE